MPSVPRIVVPMAVSGAAATVTEGDAAGVIAANRPWVWPSIPALM